LPNRVIPTKILRVFLGKTFGSERDYVALRCPSQEGEVMGLDLVELTIRVEETFGVQIPDRVAAGLTTPRKVTDFVLSQVEESPAPLPCLSQKAFHLLRRELMQHVSLSRRQFRVDSSLKEIFSGEHGEEVWKSIGTSLGVKKWPAMSRHAWHGFMSPTVSNVRELVDYLVTNEPLMVKGADAAWSRAQVWEVLKRVIIDETGTTDFSEDSRFVEDRHLD